MIRASFIGSTMHWLHWRKCLSGLWFKTSI